MLFLDHCADPSLALGHSLTHHTHRTPPPAVPQLYTESTDGSFIEAKQSALVWHYRDADPDFGSWQAKELLDHLEGVLSNEPVEVRWRWRKR